MNLEAEPGSVGFAREWPCEGTFRLLPPGEGLEAVAPVYEAARGERAGFLARTPDWWLGILPLVEKDARGGEARRLVLYETDDGPEGLRGVQDKGRVDSSRPGRHSHGGRGDRLHAARHARALAISPGAWTWFGR